MYFCIFIPANFNRWDERRISSCVDPDCILWFVAERLSLLERHELENTAEQLFSRRKGAAGPQNQVLDQCVLLHLQAMSTICYSLSVFLTPPSSFPQGPDWSFGAFNHNRRHFICLMSQKSVIKKHFHLLHYLMFVQPARKLNNKPQNRSVLLCSFLQEPGHLFSSADSAKQHERHVSMFGNMPHLENLHFSWFHFMNRNY